MVMTAQENLTVQVVSIVVPVYQGEFTLESLLEEIEPLTTTQSTPGGVQFRVSEVILVHDGAIDGSDAVMSALASRLPFVVPVWVPPTTASMRRPSPAWRARAGIGSRRSTKTASTIRPTSFICLMWRRERMSNSSTLSR